MSTLLSVCLGLGLSAACGFRIFVPLLVMSAAAHGGYLKLAPRFEWIGGTPALVTFAVATALEIGAYYIPWLDNLLDSLASPVAVVAGIVVTASVVTGLDPFLKWTLAVIAGGGLAGIFQAATGGTRGISLAATAGLGNPVVSTIEAAGSLLLSLLAIFVPLAALAGVVLLLWLGVRWRRRRRQRLAV